MWVIEGFIEYTDTYEYLFTYEKYPELNIKKTTNGIEGLFKEPKDK